MEDYINQAAQWVADNWIPVTTAAGGLVTGYVISLFGNGKRKLRVREVEADARSYEANARIAEAERGREETLTERAGLGQKLEVMKLEEEHREAQYRRKGDETSRERQHRIEYDERILRLKSEERAMFLSKLGDLKPVLDAYLGKLVASGVSPKLADCLRKRREFRDDLTERYLDKLDEDCNPSEDEYDIGEEDRKRIERLVDAKYPLPEGVTEDMLLKAPQLPPELQKLIDFISGDSERPEG